MARIVCSLLPACRSKERPITSMPNKNRASPPSREITLKMYVVIGNGSPCVKDLFDKIIILFTMGKVKKYPPEGYSRENVCT